MLLRYARKVEKSSQTCALRTEQKKIAQLQQTLDRYIQTDGEKVDDTNNKDLYTIITCNSSSVLSAD